MNNIRAISSIIEKELASGVYGGVPSSWHSKYDSSPWVYVGGLPYELTEGDIICVMSQWGEIDDFNLVRDKETNKSLGYAFVKYEDQRSTILAVDNFNGMKLLERTIRCDHVDKYRLSKSIREKEEKKLEDGIDAPLLGSGYAYADQELANDFSLGKGMNLWQDRTSSKRKRNFSDMISANIDESNEYDGDKNERSRKHSRDRKHSKDHKHSKNHKRSKDDRRSKDRKRSKEDKYLKEDNSRKDAEYAHDKYSRHHSSRDSYLSKESKESKHSIRATNRDKDRKSERYGTSDIPSFSSSRTLSSSSVASDSLSHSNISGSQPQSWRGNRDPAYRAAPLR